MKTETIKKYKRLLLNMKLKLMVLPLFLIFLFSSSLGYDYKQTIIGESGLETSLTNPRLTLYIDFEPNLYVTSGLSEAALQVTEGIWYDSYTYDEYIQCNEGLCNDTMWNSTDTYADYLNYTNPYAINYDDLRTDYLDDSDFGTIPNSTFLIENFLGNNMNYDLLNVFSRKETLDNQPYLVAIFNETTTHDLALILQRGTV